MRNQEASLLELSAPVIEVWNKILVLPLVGVMDTRRAEQVGETLLPAVVDKNAAVVIIDITGLPVMDTATANHLFRTVKAIELLGAQAILTGIRPTIAHTIVELGIDTGTIKSLARLADGLQFALSVTGQGNVGHTDGRPNLEVPASPSRRGAL